MVDIEKVERRIEEHFRTKNPSLDLSKCGLIKQSIPHSSMKQKK